MKRAFTIVKKTATEWDVPLSSQLEIFKKDLLQQQVTRVQGDTKEYILTNLLPPDIRPYTWFQGEQVDNLIDFENKEALTKAINVLSDISEYKFYVDFATKALKAAEEDALNEAVRSKKTKKAFDKLANDKSIQEDNIKRLQKEVEEANHNWSYANTQVHQLFGQVEDATKITGLQEKVIEIKKRIADKEILLETQKMQIHKQLFTKHWVLRNVGGLVENYAQKFKAYQQTKMQAIADKKAAEKMKEQLKGNLEPLFLNQLASVDPEFAYFNKMLEQEHCLICDRPAPYESEPWFKIKQLLDRATQKTIEKTPPQTDIKQDFYTTFEDLNRLGLRLQGNVANTDTAIQEATAAKQDTYDFIKLEQIHLQNTETILQNLISGSKISLENSRNIKENYSAFTKKLMESASLKEKKLEDLKNARKLLDQTETQIADAKRGKTPAYLEEKLKLLADFKQITVSTERRVFENLIATLEKKANAHFMAMTEGNQGVKGRIKLVKKEGFYMPQNVDLHGNELPNINDSNIILIKIAVILAIISAKEDSNATQLYTLITDAPSSKFTDNYTIGFCKTVSKVYKQSIIMSKDFSANKILEQRLFDPKQVSKLGNVYRIAPTVTEENRSDRNSLATIIQKIK